ncbi:adenylyl-sulfate kinase [Marinobacter sp. AC-23]|uniref:adenylyl-sulfate kinase n=1 Tax=Marinobacter sp. AC-23 TaxID=1879031 RepID=UPI0008DC66BD|nr:adenylyl-sulfate kinase [Marinobacter sp. AC-23]OHY79312.1 adenylyl-sulfate kinase [Marinobacter sp. AC-23]
MTKNIVWNEHRVSNFSRAAIKEQNPCLIWFTGLSGSGKSTLANALDVALHSMGYHTALLDGDNIRHGLSKDLGFSESDRVENIRRIGEVSKLFADAGLIVSASFISPFSHDRDIARSLLSGYVFVEVYVNTPLTACENRDPKGLYKKARERKIPNFTGVDSKYEPPISPDLRLNTTELSVEQCVAMLIDLLRHRGVIRHITAEN